MAGCGWLGRAIVAGLRARGDRVTAVRRSLAGLEEAEALGAVPLPVDLTDDGAADRLPRDLEAIVACQAAHDDSPAAYRAAYVVATGHLVDVAARVGAALVYTGSTGVFGQSDGSVVDETTPPAPEGESAAILLEAERLVLAAATRGVASRVVRLSGLYGPERTGIVERVRTGRLALGPGDDVWMNFCHRDDAVATILGALARGRDGAVYHASDACPARRRDVVRWIAARIGIEPPCRSGPTGVEPRGRRGANRRVAADRTREELGLRLVYPSFRDGLSSLIAGGNAVDP